MHERDGATMVESGANRMETKRNGLDIGGRKALQVNERGVPGLLLGVLPIPDTSPFGYPDKTIYFSKYIIDHILRK